MLHFKWNKEIDTSVSDGFYWTCGDPDIYLAVYFKSQKYDNN